MNQSPANTENKDPIADAAIQLKGYFLYATLFSASTNILMLTPILYMLQVYDRVVSSGSMTTLSMLSVLMVLLLVSSGGFEWVRGRLMIAANVRLEQNLRDPVFIAAFKAALSSSNPAGTSQAMQDMVSLRQFATGAAAFAVMDIPWVPIYIGIMFIFHPLFGIAAIVTSIILVGLAVLTQKLTGKKMAKANSLNQKSQGSFLSNLRNAEVIHGMGMADNVRRSANQLHDGASDEQANASASAGKLAAISKTFRLISQSALLGLGAYLALAQEISPGMMIAGSLLLGRALAPIDAIVGNWKSFVDSKGAYIRLRTIMKAFPPDKIGMVLPDPTGKLSVERIIVAPPMVSTPCLKGISFELNAGETLGIIGPSAAGKTSLARAILGVWPAASGTVRLDGAEMKTWDREKLGPHLGYLPQDIELFDGSIAENICRFSTIESGKIIEAAKTAGIHDMILQLPDGYETRITASSGRLSAGQRQRVGIARAIYDNPRLIVLDEPNSNLDEQGERELVSALKKLKESGSTIIIITHRTAILSITDKIMILKDGLISAFGEQSEVLKALKVAKANVTKLPQPSAKRTHD